jgi:hypothetical protein
MQELINGVWWGFHQWWFWFSIGWLVVVTAGVVAFALWDRHDYRKRTIKYLKEYDLNGRAIK